MHTPAGNTSPLLHWVLRQGHDLLSFEVDRVGERYRVSVSSPRLSRRLYARLCQGGSNALHLHAALVADFRDAGWAVVSYH